MHLRPVELHSGIIPVLLLCVYMHYTPEVTGRPDPRDIDHNDLLQNAHLRPEDNAEVHHVIAPDVAMPDMPVENFTLPYGPSYGYWPDGTVYPCRTAEECAEMYNDTDPLSDDLLFEDDISQPCIMQGHLDISKNWYGYLATMTMKAQSGRFYYHFEYPDDKCCIKILLYLEEEVASLRAHMNCLQKQSIVDPSSQQVITLSPGYAASGCNSNKTRDGVRMIECTSGRILRSDIDRNWYIAASSCGSPDGLDVKYSLVLYGYRGECPTGSTLYTSAANSLHVTYHAFLPSCVLLLVILTLTRVIIRLQGNYSHIR